MPEISEDGLTYTFKIREGLRYSNRKPVRASDFEHTIKRVLRLGVGGSLFTTIDGAEGVREGQGRVSGHRRASRLNDKEREVTVRLLERDPTFLNKLAKHLRRDGARRHAVQGPGHGPASRGRALRHQQGQARARVRDDPDARL